MSDKDKGLPLVEQNTSRIEGAMNLNRDFASGYMQGMVEQRDKDWERVQPLMEAINAFLRKLTECEEALAGIYGLAFAHGVQYEGPNYNKERESLKQALATLLDEEKP